MAKTDDQISKMIGHMKRNGSISQREAYIEYGVQGFSARISDIRKFMPLKAERRRNPVTGQRYTRYSLDGQY
jgi:hypothetical protein